MNTPPGIPFESLNEQPTVVDGQRHREVLSATRGVLVRPDATRALASRRPSLHACCITCGATASDWRHLLGVGAVVVACPTEAQSALLTYPGACGKCGASKLLVNS
jgi:hypothetical protein